jgi:hypothetical protein
MKNKGQQGIYGIVLAVIGLIIWAAVNPTIEAQISLGLTYLNVGSMEAILTPFLSALIPIVIIGYIIVNARI